MGYYGEFNSDDIFELSDTVNISFDELKVSCKGELDFIKREVFFALKGIQGN